MLQIDVLTLFPPMFEAVTEWGVTGRARERGLYQLVAWNPRDFAQNAYRTVDDRPYGGGPGMVLMPGPLGSALQAARQRQKSTGVQRPLVLHLSPQGPLLDHAKVVRYAREKGLVLIAGRYEGVDERVIARHVDEEVSIGDYVLSGGELPAMVVIDGVVRHLPGALGDADSANEDSFADGLLDCPHYTRPEVFDGVAVPQVLLSGNHAEIARWRLKQKIGRTFQRRPDLLERRALTAEEQALLNEYRNELQGA
jgi:tRNA (guanine37-N1)-methyltransferase